MFERLEATFVLACFASSASADVIDVGGANPDFTEIEHAVAAANDGDVIRVEGSAVHNYRGFTVVDKDLRVVAVPGTGPVLVSRQVFVRDLSAGKSVLLRGIEVDNFGTDAAGLSISNCSGHVRIEDSVFRARGGSDLVGTPLPHGVEVLSSADVALVTCEAFAGRGCDEWDCDVVTPSGHGLYAQDSTVTVYDCHLVGARGTEYERYEDGLNGGDGLAASGSTIYASGCRFVGGDGGSGGHCGVFGVDGGDGGRGGNAVAVDSSSRVGLLENRYQPGDGGLGGSDQCSFDGSDGPPGIDVLVSADSEREDYLGPARRVSVQAIALEGTLIPVQIEGRFFDRVLLFHGRPGYSQLAPFAGPHLLRWFPGNGGTGSIADRLIAGGTLDARGRLTLPLDLPNLPHLGHVTWHLQALVWSRNRMHYISSTSAVTVLDSAH